MKIACQKFSGTAILDISLIHVVNIAFIFQVLHRAFQGLGSHRSVSDYSKQIVVYIRILFRQFNPILK